MIFQMTFAIITPALITGAFADRMKFSAMLIFVGAWSVLIYAPLTHMVWMTGGLMFDWGVLDFAGGTVVHISSGISGLVAALDDRQAQRLSQDAVRAAQPGLHGDGRLDAVGRLVRLQRRLGARGFGPTPAWRWW